MLPTHVFDAGSQALPGAQSLVLTHVVRQSPSPPQTYGAQGLGPSAVTDESLSSEQVAPVLQTPPLQENPLAQSLAELQVVRQVLVDGSQANLPHDELVGAAQLPFPSHVDSGRSESPSHAAGLHTTEGPAL